MNLDEKINDIYPGCIDNTDFRYVKIDNIYSSSILISNFPRYTTFLQIIESIPKKYSYDMSIFIKKQDNMKILKDLTYYISSSSSEIKTSNSNQIDIDLMSKVKDDAKELRKQIQINEQEIFFINILITFYSEDKKLLFEIIRDVQSIIYSKGLTSNIANFRHLDSYLLNLPLNKNKEKLLELNERCFTTNSLSFLFPFYTKTIFDKNGIIFGFTEENKICNIDIFDEKYINSNMCILGSSGSGKSYFTKLLVIRLFLNGKTQYIIDPEGEYVNIAKSLKCNYIQFSSKDTKYYFNPFEIVDYEIYLHGNNVINYKSESITNMICYLCNIKIEEEILYLKNKILELYNSFNIKNVEDVYNKSCENKIYVNKKIIDSNKFPTFLDFIEFIDSKKIQKLIKNNIVNKYKVFSSHTNMVCNCKLLIFDTSNLDNKADVFFVNEIIKNIVNNLKYKKSLLNNELQKSDTEKTVIYIDEIWKYIKKYNTKDERCNIDLGAKIFELFKTIRKYNAGIVAITQDISDFFLLEDGNYGKSIINNSNFKMFFKLDFSDSEFLEKYYILNKKELYKVNRLDKGQGLCCFKNINLTLNIKANKYEEEILEEVQNEDYNSFE